MTSSWSLSHPCRGGRHGGDSATGWRTISASVGTAPTPARATCAVFGTLCATSCAHRISSPRSTSASITVPDPRSPGLVALLQPGRLRLAFLLSPGPQEGWAVGQIPYQRTGRTLPEILSRQEVAALFRATPNPKHRALLMTMYAGGLRVAEVTHLRITDIDSQRMVIRIEQGKGRQDRYVMLSPTCTAPCKSTGECGRPRPCASQTQRAVLSPARASSASFTRPGGAPRSPSACSPIRCGTPAPPTGWRAGPISG